MSASFKPTTVRKMATSPGPAKASSAAGGAGAGAGAGAAATAPAPAIRATKLPIPILRTASLYNANVRPIDVFDVTKIGFQVPSDGFFKDSMDGVCIPLTYDGDYAMNHGWIVPHGRFDLLESTIKGDRQVQLMANYPVKTLAEGVPAEADKRQRAMYNLLAAILNVEDKAKRAIVADTAGSMFGVAFAAHELESKTRMDGKLEKGKFSSLIYAGANKTTGEPAYLKSFFKVPLIEGERLYCTLTLNGTPISAPDLATWLENVTWKNDVGIVFSFRDLYKCSHGISLRVRIDTVGVTEPPKPSPVPLFNPFAAGAMAEDD
jgi:hypothetical protein